VSEPPCRVLILDHDPDVLTHLQHVLEDGGLDTTIIWDCVEARELTRNTSYDVILVGNHSPEVAAETFLQCSAARFASVPAFGGLRIESRTVASTWHRHRGPQARTPQSPASGAGTFASKETGARSGTAA